jgi:hypothetical protein
VLFKSRSFDTTGEKQMGMMEVAAFLKHVGAKTSCEFRPPSLFAFYSLKIMRANERLTTADSVIDLVQACCNTPCYRKLNQVN